MKKGLLIVFSGPSGVGKGTIRAKLFEKKDLNLAYSVSMTTRNPRPGEVDGVDYFFVTDKQFQEAIEKDELLENASFVGNSYGTPKAYVEKLRNEGKNVMLEIEVEGAKQVISKCKDAISIFLIPPSEQALEERIRNRKTESEEVIQARMQKAHKELQQKDIYTHVIVNDEVERASKACYDILKKYIDEDGTIKLKMISFTNSFGHESEAYSFADINDVEDPLIQDGLTYCLFGEIINGSEPIFDPESNAEPSVYCELEYKGKVYQITRTIEFNSKDFFGEVKSHPSRFSLSVDGVEQKFIIAETVHKFLKDNLGLELLESEE